MIQASSTAVTLPAVWAGAVLGGVVGAAWGLTLGSGVLLAASASVCRRSLARHDPIRLPQAPSATTVEAAHDH